MVGVKEESSLYKKGSSFPCEAPFKGQNCEVLNDQDSLKSKDGHEPKRTISYVPSHGPLTVINFIQVKNVETESDCK